jgi:hypothetical protein
VLFQDGHVLLDVELVFFPGLGNILCRGFVHERCCQGLIGYGMIVSRRRLSWCPGMIWMDWCSFSQTI